MDKNSYNPNDFQVSLKDVNKRLQSDASKSLPKDSEAETKKAFLDNIGKEEFTEDMTPAYNEFKAKIAGTKQINDMQKNKSEEDKKKDEEKATEQSKATQSATSAYDSGTTQQSSDKVDSKTQLANVQKTANAINEKADNGETVPNKEESEKMGEDAANADHELSEEEVKENTESEPTDNNTEAEVPEEQKQANLATAKKVTETNPAIENAITDATNGGDITEDSLANAGNNVSDTVGGADVLGTAEAEKVVENSMKLGTWDKLAIGLTAVSFIMCALTGGAILPINFTAFGGTAERISNLNSLKKDYAQFKQKQNMREEEFNTIEAKVNEFKKKNPGATQKEIEDFRTKYTNTLGKQEYGNEAQSAKDTSDLQGTVQLKNLDSDLALKYLDRSTALTLDKDLKEMDAQTLNTIKINAANTKNAITQLMSQGDQQRATATLLQNLQDKSPAQKYQYVLDITGDEASALRSINLPSSGDTALEWAKGVTDMVNKTVGTAANVVSTLGLAPSPSPTSDENKKEVVHNYIADRLNRHSKKHTYIPKERR